MKKLFASLLIMLFIALSTFSAKSMWMVGTDFEWTCVGQDSFLISLSIYRDCNAVNIGSATIPIKCATTGATITSLSIAKPQGIDVTPTCDGEVNRCQTYSSTFPYGVDKYIFTKLLVLSNAGSCCKIRLSYSMCCRPSHITTGAAGQNYYNEAILDRCLSPCDNSAKFTKDPFSLICIGQDVVFNSGIINTDTNTSGLLLDSISYEWTPPLSASGSTIAYTSPYSYTKPIDYWIAKGFNLNKQTGDINFRPMKIQVSMMCLKVKQWRKVNGSMTNISEQTRDFLVTVMSCPNNNTPILNGPYYKEICAGDTVNMNISSTDYDTGDSLSISCNNTITGSNWTSNNGSAIHPTGTFSWVTTENDVSNNPYIFTVSLKDDNCPMEGRATRAYQILVKPIPNANLSRIDSGCGHYYFKAQIVDGKFPTFTWSGSFVTGNLIHGKSIYHKFSDPGTYPYRLDITAQQCSNSYLDTLIIAASYIKSGTPHHMDVCYGDIASLTAYYVNNSGLVSFNWSTGDTTQTINYLVTTDTLVTVDIKDNSGCTTIDSFFLNMHKLPIVDLGSDQYICHNSSQTIDVNYTLDENALKSIKWYDQANSLVSQTNQITVYDSMSFS